MSEKQKSALVWFRNDLRTSDNNSLLNAITSQKRVIGLYCFDPRSFEINAYGFKKTEKFRAKFLIESVENLSKKLAKLNISLLTPSGKPEDIIPDLVKQFNINQVFLQKEWTSEEEQVLAQVKSATPEGVSFTENYDQFLFHPDDIPFDFAQVPQVFTNFRKACEKVVRVREPLLEPWKLPESNLIETRDSLPALQDLGLEGFETDRRTAFPFNGGEDNALDRLLSYFWKSRKLSFYKKTRNGLVGTDYSSKFSPWLANGSISPRKIYHEVKRFEKEVEKNNSTYWLVFELIWRDYFKYVSLKYGNRIFKLGGILNRDYEWKTDPYMISNWINGKTTSSFVNANMLELKQTGWMSNRGRQNVGSYFAKELELDWRIGAAYFESTLLDYDVHSNYGNWMYVAGVGNDPRNRKFNVATQAQRYDPHSRFQNQWLQQKLFH